MHEILGDASSWCGKGVYFYDVKGKAWWAATRKCDEIKKDTGRKIKPMVLFADIIDLEQDKILDMRIHSDLCDFESEISELLGKYKLELPDVDDTERIILLRSMLISYYAEKKEKKLIVGNFRQRPQPKYEHSIEFANSLDMIFGIETIYCVKDKDIIKNIRKGGRVDGK